MTKKAVLVDGNSLAYRAFYALPDTMKNSKGITTNAIYGFVSMIMKLIEEDPDFMAVAFDRKEPTFRHNEYKEYKATRQKAPPTLYEQFPYIKEFLSGIGIKVFEIAGFEADDIIGTLAKKAEKEGFFVEIVSGDMDPLQLVNEKINVVTTKKGISDVIKYDEKAVFEKYKLKPEQLIDYKALKGDSSDNIPGIPGIGEKTATTLLQEYKTLDNIFENVANIEKQRIKEIIEKGKDMAILSKRLGTIVTNVPIDMDLSKKVLINWANLLSFFREMEFKTLISKYADKLPKDNKEIVERKRAEISKYDFSLVESKDDFLSLIERIKSEKEFAFDTETDNINPQEANLVGISFSFAKNSAFYIPVGHKNAKNLPLKEIIKDLKDIFENKTILKIGQNLKYDIEVLNKHGISVFAPHFDTMVAAYLIDPTTPGYGLKKLASQYLNRDEMIKFDEITEKDFSEVEINTAKDYSCSDANATYELKLLFDEKLKEYGMSDLFYNIEMPLMEVLTIMEETGVFVDTKILKELSIKVSAELKDLERHIFAIAGEEFNINSPKQLGNILFTKLSLPVIKKTKTGPSTDAEVLEELSSKFEIAEKLLEYRSLSKLKSTYIDVLPELINKKTGRIHASFNQTITATGRLSSSNPNMQNIPIKTKQGKEIRKAFTPQESGYKIISADYSQIELRVLAHLSGDKNLIDSFIKDEDIHTRTASEIFNTPKDLVTKEMRSTAKTVNFGVIYGISDFGLSKSLRIKRSEASAFIEKYFKQYPGVKDFIEKTIKEARESGLVCTMLGRKRPIPDINSPNQGMRSFAERIATNTPIQGTAADMIKIAMINIENFLSKNKMKTSMILQVHDELVFESPDDEVETVKNIVEKEMREAVPLLVPIKIDIGIGKSWAEAE